MTQGETYIKFLEWIEYGIEVSLKGNGIQSIWFNIASIQRLQICSLYIFGNKATDGTYGSKYFGETRVWLWFRAKSTTLYNVWIHETNTQHPSMTSPSSLRKKYWKFQVTSKKEKAVRFVNTRRHFSHIPWVPAGRNKIDPQASQKPWKQHPRSHWSKLTSRGLSKLEEHHHHHHHHPTRLSMVLSN